MKPNLTIHFIFFLIVLFTFSWVLHAQVPKKISYQAVIRDNNNQLITSTQIGLRISVLSGFPEGSPVYMETHTASTNANGLVTVEIGEGNTNYVFDDITWEAGPYYLQVEVDPNGSSEYTISGYSELLSVPFALYAANVAPGQAGGDLEGSYPNPQIAENAITDEKISDGAVTGEKIHPMGAQMGEVLTFNGLYWEPGKAGGSSWNSSGNNIFRTEGFVGVGGIPQQKLDVKGKLNIGDDSNSPSAGAIRFNNEKSDFEGFNGLEYLSFTGTNEIEVLFDRSLSVSSTIRNNWVHTNTLLPVPVSGTYMIFYRCNLFGLIGNTISFPSDMSVDIELTSETDLEVIRVDGFNYSADLESLAGGGTSWHWRQGERVNDMALFTLNEGSALRMRIRVNDNGIQPSPSSTWTVSGVKVFAVKVK